MCWLMFEIGRLARCCCGCCWCFPSRKMQNPTPPWSMAPWRAVACCWRSCPRTAPRLSARASHPLLTCPFPHPILAFSRFLGSNPFLPPPPLPQAPRRPSLQPPRALQLVVSTVARSSRSSTCPSSLSSAICPLPHQRIARGRPRMNLPTQQHTHAGPDLQCCCCCPSSRCSSHLQLAPGPPTMGISSGKR